MRKKIFIIHGKGIVNGLGSEGGGDLDTVGSNSFYAAWIKNLIRKEDNREAEYGQDYEYDFVNYQAGLSHLKIHKGCDIYLPDFPVDALSPRLKLLIFDNEEDIKIREKTFLTYDNFKLNIYNNALNVDNDLKEIYNSLINKIKNYFSDLSKFEIAVLNELLLIFNQVITISSFENNKSDKSSKELDSVFKSFFSGINFKLIREQVSDIINDRFFQDLKDKYIKDDPSIVKALDDFRKIHLSVSFKIKISPNLIILLVETYNILRELRILISRYSKLLKKDDIQQLNKINDNVIIIVMKELSRFGLFVNEIKLKKGSSSIKLNIKNCINLFKYLKNIKENRKSNKIVAMLIEDDNLSPVADVDITFTRVKGNVDFTAKGKKSNKDTINVKTDKKGSCVVALSGKVDKEYYIKVTFDDLSFLKFTNIEDEETLKLLEEEQDNSLPDEHKDTGEIYSETEEIVIEKGDSPTRALQVSLQLIEKDFKILKKNNIDMIRIDDHHPWTKEIIDLLNKLKDKGYIKENITMSGPPRGEEQEKEEQKCGTDLIYESLIKETEFDNSGYKKLCYLAHVQDLHIKEDELAIDLSKLIGSGFSKIEMVEKLSSVISNMDMKRIMQKNGWDKVVKQYEKSLDEVLPRVEKNIVKVTLLNKPKNNNYNCNLGIYNLLKPLGLFKKNKDGWIRKLYQWNTKNRLDVYMALSPFTDRKAGEAKINVASSINYLKNKYKMDYFFYCYGSMLMTTRKVNPKKKGVNLSSLVAYLGTKADGGHPEAATGKPSSNPAFPQKLFAKVNDSNFFEYSVYIGNKTSEFSNKELVDIQETKILQYETEIEKKLHALEHNILYMYFKNKDNVVLKIMLVKNVPGVNVSAAVNYLIYRKKYNIHYLLFVQGAEKLIIRNINDRSNSIDIDKLVKIIGSKDNNGYLKVGIAFPKNNKKFPIDSLKFINTFNFCEYGFYLKDRIEELEDIKFEKFEEVEEKNLKPVFKHKLNQINNSLSTNLINYKGRNYKISYAFSPSKPSFKRKDAFSVTSALSYIKRTNNSDIIIYTDGFSIVIRKYQDCSLPLRELIPLFANVKNNSSEFYTNFIVNDLIDLKKYCNGFINALSFPVLVEYINDKIRTKESIQLISTEDKFVNTISAAGEEIIDKAFRSHVKLTFYNREAKITMVGLMMPYYNEKEVQITVNEIVTYVKGRLKGFNYLMFFKGKNELILKNVSDNNNVLDLSKVSELGAVGDKLFKTVGLLHPNDNKKFPKDVFIRVDYHNFQEFADYIGKRIAEVFNLSIKME